MPGHGRRHAEAAPRCRSGALDQVTQAVGDDVVVLEHHHVPRLGQDHQLGAGHPLDHVPAVVGRGHRVLLPTEDQRLDPVEHVQRRQLVVRVERREQLGQHVERGRSCIWATNRTSDGGTSVANE